MPSIDDITRLHHIMDAARKALSFTKGLSRQHLDSDEKLTLALTRLLEIIGEAASQMTPETKNRFPAIPWKKIVGMRNKLIHGYAQVNLDNSGETLHFQIFIEPKGEHLLRTDEWKERFLKRLKDEHLIEQLWQSHNYVVWGMPFYNENLRKIVFNEAFSLMTDIK